MENKNFCSDITSHNYNNATPIQKIYSITTFIVERDITSQFDSCKRYFHDFSLEKTLLSFHCRDTRAKLHLASPYQKLDVYRLFVRDGRVPLDGPDRGERSVLASWHSHRFASFQDGYSQVVGARIPPISWNVARYRWKVSRSHFANAISWSWNTYYKSKWTERTNWAWGQRFLNLY